LIKKAWKSIAAGVVALIALTGCSALPQPTQGSGWTEFADLPTHNNPIPRRWIATSEGRFAHELKIPNPVSADAGYRAGMTSVDYYLHLCATEAGEFKFRTVSGVKGIFFARPPAPPTDQDLMDRWVLEHPLLESKFQLVDTAVERAVSFVNPPFMDFLFYEEPEATTTPIARFLRLSGYQQDMRDQAGNLTLHGTPMQQKRVEELASRYGITWRGIHRPFDRENGIAGGEVIVFDLRTHEILYLYRNYAFSGRVRNAQDGIWWLTSGGCRSLFRREDRSGLHALSVRARDVLKK
jgi:hypothetical protein